MTTTSAAMSGREVPPAVITPDGNFDKKRPTLYLLNGAGGIEQGMDWIIATAKSDVAPEQEDVQDMVDFYTSKDVKVVIPQADAFSYCTDWVSSPEDGYFKDPQKWETFPTKELPGTLEAHIGGNGKRDIAGMSMSATSSLLLAEHNPGFYNAVGSFSGCAATSPPAAAPVHSIDTLTWPSAAAAARPFRCGALWAASTTCTTTRWSIPPRRIWPARDLYFSQQRFGRC